MTSTDTTTTLRRTLVSTSFVSVDGQLDPTGGDPEFHDTKWTFKTVDFLPEAYALKGEETQQTSALLFGRRSYQLFAPVWPGMAEFEAYRSVPKYVVSTSLSEADLVDDWGPQTVLRSLDEVAELKTTEGGTIFVHGSATLNRALAGAGLIDRYHLLVFPVLLGQGKPLFPPADQSPRSLRLVDHEVYANGIQKQVFDVVR